MSIKGIDPTKPESTALAGEGDDQIRQFKSDVQACFPNLEASIVNSGGDGDSEDTGNTNANPPNAATFSALFDRLAALEGGTGAGLVVGEIKPWYGDVANLPTGWYICDGTNGTPDLRGRFLVGDNSSPPSGLPLYNDNTNGGGVQTGQVTGPAGNVTAQVTVDPHTIGLNNLPEHFHYVAKDNAGGGTPNLGDAASAYPINSHDGGGDAEYRMKRSASTSDEANVGKTSVAGGVSGSPDDLTHNSADVVIPAHSHTIPDGNLPPWHAVYYIMYTGV